MEIARVEFTGSPSWHSHSDFDFSNYRALRKLQMQAAGCSYTVLRLPPNVQEVFFRYISISPYASDQMAGAMERLVFENCTRPPNFPPADLSKWLCQAGPAYMGVPMGPDWTLGPSLEHFERVVRDCRVRTLRLEAGIDLSLGGACTCEDGECFSSAEQLVARLGEDLAPEFRAVHVVDHERCWSTETYYAEHRIERVA